MKFIKRLTCTILILGIINSLGCTAYGYEEDYNKTESQTVSDTEQINDLNIQLDELYHRVGEQLNINYMYVKMIHLIAGGKAVYAEEIPNIYVDLTADSLSGPFDIEGANQEYKIKAEFIICPDDKVGRPNKRYLPDAAYNVTADIVKLMNQRLRADRGSIQEYFDSLDKSVKTNILFCEAILRYTGSSDIVVNSFYSIYEQMLYEKKADENVIEINEDSEYIFKEKFLKILNDNGIVDKREINILTTIFRFDKKLAASSILNDIIIKYPTPYKINYSSRENLLMAAMSVVGKVKYIWGGGHLSTGQIEGINPIWESFYNSYGEPTDEEGNFNKEYFTCIKPGYSYCPIHGELMDENGCLFKADTVYDIDEYLDERADIIDKESYNTEGLYQLFEKVNFEDGVLSHRLDGLDCSGYMSWVFNQITDKYTYDSGAIRFISQAGIKELDENERLLPGDVFSWGAHIIMIIGKEEKDNNSFVMIEAGPNTVKFGVAYLDNASYQGINNCIQIAKEANKLLGNIDDNEIVRTFNMSELSYSPEDTEDEYFGYRGFGRFKPGFIDEYTVINDSGKRIVDMTAIEIIQHMVDRFDTSYISGINTYEGEIFSTDNVNKIIIGNDTIDYDVIEDENIATLSNEI